MATTRGVPAEPARRQPEDGSDVRPRSIDANRFTRGAGANQ